MSWGLLHPRCSGHPEVQGQPAQGQAPLVLLGKALFDALTGMLTPGAPETSPDPRNLS